MQSYTNVPIKFWAVEDRPREKLIQRGIDALTDAELLAILLGTGVTTSQGRKSALDLARGLLSAQGGLPELARSGLPGLTRTKGIGKAKALTLIAAFELGRRQARQRASGFKATDSASVAAYLKPQLAHLRQEVFWVLYFNRNSELIGEEKLFQGGVSSTIIDTRLVIKQALEQLATAIIVAHNHPSGNLQPSQADRNITQKLESCSQMFDIQLLDHLIISERGYYSFADSGLLSSGR